MTVSVTCYTISMYESFVVEAREWNFIQLEASKLMVVASDGFHGVLHLFVVE